MAAHPDDAVLGCGATIAWHAAAGDSVHIVAFADGIMGRKGLPKEERGAEFAEHARAAKEASLILGAASFSQLDFPDTRLDTVPQLDLARAAEEAVALRKADIVYTHHVGDLNTDHVRVHDAVCVACRPVPESSVRTLLFFEVQSSTEGGLTANRSFQTGLSMLPKRSASNCKPWKHSRWRCGPFRMRVRSTPSGSWRGGAARAPASAQRKRRLGRRIE